MPTLLAPRIAAALALCAALAGCEKELYSELDEAQANEMVSVLAASGIAAGRERDQDNVYAVTVKGADVAAAVTLLRAEGLPRARFESLGDVFASGGIVGSPFEQQARFVHAMNQELSNSVTSIHGVRSARVLVTAPPKDRYARESPPASASVVIHHEAAFDAEAHVSTIKTMVAHSLPNLEYDAVAVALFPAEGPEARPAAARPALPPTHTAALFPSALPGGVAPRLLLAAAGAALLAALAAALWRASAGGGQ